MPETAVLSGEVVAGIVGEVVSSMAALEALGEAAVPACEGPSATAIVGIIGKPGRMVVIKLAEKTACALAGGMLMSEYAAWNDEVRDAVSEVANMTAGNIKARCFGEQGLSLSLPTVIFGGNYSLSPTRLKVVLDLGVATSGGALRVSVAEEI